MRNVLPLLAASVLALTGAAGAADLSAKKAMLIKAMNGNGCMMTTAQGNVQMPQMGISRPEAIAISRQMMAEGIATFAADEETLLLLPPACIEGAGN